MIKNDRADVWWKEKLQLSGMIVGFLLLVVGCESQDSPQAYSGIVEYEETTIAFEVGGRLVKRPATRGAEVKKGELIARIDDSLERANREVRRDEAQAALAQVDVIEAGPKKTDLWTISSRIHAAQAVEARLSENLARETKLLEKKVTPQAVVDDLEHQLEQAQAETQSLQAQYASLSAGARKEEVESVKARAQVASQTVTLQEQLLERYQVNSPLEGTVLDVHAEPGETVAPGAPIVTVADTRHPLIEVFVPQQDLAGVHLGVKATMKVDASSQEFSGVVETIARRTEFTPRFIFSEEERPRLVVRVRVRINDPKQELHAGVPGFVSFL